MRELVNARNNLGLDGNGSRSQKHEAFIGWEFLARGWIKCNIDGPMRNNSFAGCGSIFRDESGSWLLGFSKYVGEASALVAQLWGLLTGMKSAWSHGWRHVCFEMDSDIAFNLVNNACLC